MVDSHEKSSLHPWGWSSFFQNQWEQLNDKGGLLARVLGEERDHFSVILETQQKAKAIMKGKWKRRHHDHENPCVGDWVILAKEATQNEGHSSYLIETILQRSSQILRKAAGEQKKAQILASNVDTAFIVTSWDHDFDLRRMERYLAIIDELKIKPVIVVNKSDQQRSSEQESLLRQNFSQTAIAFTRADQPETIFKLVDFLGQGRTGIFLGSSGVGKSTLTNILLEEERQKVSPTRVKDSKGRHTTTGRTLHLLPQNRGLIVDSPGLREIQLVESATNLDDAFSDILDLATSCRFPQCRHLTEPHCAVTEALKKGMISRERLLHFQKLKAELESQKPWMKKNDKKR